MRYVKYNLFLCVLTIFADCAMVSAQSIHLKHQPQYILYTGSKWHKPDTVNRFDSLHRKQGFWIIYDSTCISPENRSFLHKNDSVMYHVKWSGMYVNGLRQGVWKNAFNFAENRVECHFVNNIIRYPILEYEKGKIARSVHYDYTTQRYKVIFYTRDGQVEKTEFRISYPFIFNGI